MRWVASVACTFGHKRCLRRDDDKPNRVNAIVNCTFGLSGCALYGVLAVDWDCRLHCSKYEVISARYIEGNLFAARLINSIYT